MTEQVRLVEEAIGSEVEPFGRGGESSTFRLRGSDLLVTVPSSWPDERPPAEELMRRAELLRRVGERVSVPVPHVERVLPGAGLVVVRMLTGDRLIHVAPARRREVRREVAGVLGTVLAELHTWEPGAYGDLAEVDDYSDADRLREAAETAADLAPLLSASQRHDVRAFLSEPAPAPAPALVLSHNDLGIEHVLVSEAPGSPLVTGVIDWDDAAVCDPAHDFGLLLRDLGPQALDTALAAYAAGGGSASGIPARARFYARCKLLEDLAFGHAERRAEYVAKSTDAWASVFGP